MTDLTNAYRDIATRIVNAETDFAETIATLGNVDMTVARKITTLYLKKKLAKLDPVIGRVNVKHGAYLDPQAIANAAKMVA